MCDMAITFCLPTTQLDIDNVAVQDIAQRGGNAYTKSKRCGDVRLQNGGSAVVYIKRRRVHDNNGHDAKEPPIATKVFNCGREDEAKAEIDALERLGRHRGIVHYLGHRRDATTDRVCIDMELALGCLIDMDADKRSEVAPTVASHLLRALDHVHAHDLAHLDIKPDNVLYFFDASVYPTRLRFKLCDFGSSSRTDRLLSHKVGTLAYMAPEILIGGLAYDAKMADMWSIGVVLFSVSTNGFPCSERALREIWKRKLFEIDLIDVSLTQYPPRTPITPTVLDIVRHCVRIDPAQRATAKSALQLAQHFLL